MTGVDPATKIISLHLLHLLELYLRGADEYEDLQRGTIAKTLSVKEQEARTLKIQIQHTLPLKKKCKQAGFTYAEVSEIIPGAFETTSHQRRRAFKQLDLWVRDTYEV